MYWKILEIVHCYLVLYLQNWQATGNNPYIPKAIHIPCELLDAPLGVYIFWSVIVTVLLVYAILGIATPPQWCIRVLASDIVKASLNSIERVNVW